MKQRNGQRVLDDLLKTVTTAQLTAGPVRVELSLETSQQVNQALFTLKTIHKRLDGLEPTPWTLDEIRSDLSLGGFAIRQPGAVFDDRTARGEGWELANVNGVCVIRMCAEQDRFEKDADALLHVAQCAIDGSDYHRAALGFNGQTVDEDEG